MTLTETERRSSLLFWQMLRQDVLPPRDTLESLYSVPTSAQVAREMLAELGIPEDGRVPDRGPLYWGYFAARSLGEAYSEFYQLSQLQTAKAGFSAERDLMARILEDV